MSPSIRMVKTTYQGGSTDLNPPVKPKWSSAALGSGARFPFRNIGKQIVPKIHPRLGSSCPWWCVACAAPCIDIDGGEAMCVSCLANNC